MKFLCPVCKAKYQIGDEKVEGRTLRMKCRKCENEILIKGGTVSVGGARESEIPPATGGTAGRAKMPSRTPAAGPAPRGKLSSRPMSQAPAAPRVPQKPGALGADFRRQVATSTSEPPAAKANASIDQWHVAINDVPVGPMKRDELQKKISSGLVSGESLGWREGYDDWRPLKEIAELAPMLRRSLPPTPKASLGPGGRGVPAPPPRGMGPGTGRPAAPGRIGGPNPPQGGRGQLPAAARSNVVPIGGRLGAGAAPAIDEMPGYQAEQEATRVAENPLFDENGNLLLSMPPPQEGAHSGIGLAGQSSAGGMAAPSDPIGGVSDPFGPPVKSMPQTAAPVVVQRTGLSMNVIILGIGGCAMAIALGVFAGAKYFSTHTKETIEKEVPIDRTVYVDREKIVHVHDQDPNATATKNKVGPTKRPDTPTTTGTTPTGTAAPDEFAQYADNSGGVGRIRHNSDDDQQANTGEEMSADQVRAVVTRNRGQAQQCYEMAARQTGITDAIRVNAHVKVRGSGQVQTVAVTGGPDPLNRCIETSIRHWIWPGAGEADLPFVFQPGAH